MTGTPADSEFFDCDLVVAGGGAAGFFAAIVCAEASPGAGIVIVEKSREVLGKGTGVNTVETGAEAYVNAVNKLLIKTKSGPVDGGEIQGP